MLVRQLVQRLWVYFESNAKEKQFVMGADGRAYDDKSY